MGMTTTTHDLFAVPQDLISIKEEHQCHCSFNVMPSRPVEETLHVREYRTGERYVEAHFDREYRSSMAASPSHLIFLTALVHTQKMLYLALCREFDLDYDPLAAEQFKMWPTKIDVRIPELIAEESGLVQQLWIRRVNVLPNGARRAVLDVRVGSLQIRATCPVFMLADGAVVGTQSLAN